MLNVMTFGRYRPGTSILHRSDPRTKILLTLLLIVTVYLVKSLPALLVLFFFTFAVGAIVGKPLRHSLLGLKPILYLTAGAVAVKLVTTPGPPLVDCIILRNISPEALLASMQMIIRLIILAAAASLLTFCTTPFALTQGLERLLRPLGRIGLPTAEIAMILLIALRFMPVLADEAKKLLGARSAGAEPSTRESFTRRIKDVGALFIPLFTCLARRGASMVAAMEARCYRGCSGRTNMRPLDFSKADFACALGWLMVVSLAIVAESLWIGGI
jgi:energy-coupling factor transport system permease protein